MDKLKELLSKCKCSVYVTVNEHKNDYKTAAEALEDLGPDGFRMSSEVREKIIETDTLICVQFYPDTPIGFYHVMHYDLDAALDLALACFKK